MGMRLHALTFAAIAGSLWLATTTGAVAQTEGPGRALAASNVLRLTADAQRSTTNSFPATLKQFYVPYTGTVRVKWQSRTSDATSAATVFVSSRVATCIVPTNSLAFQGDQCDIRVSAGDLVTVGASAQNMGTTAFIRLVRVHYDVVDFNGLGAVLQN